MCEGYGHQYQVEERLANVGVDVCDGRGEGLDVLSEGVIGVGEPRVKVAHSVVGLVLEVEGVGVVHETRADGERQLALDVADEAVDECRRECQEDPVHQECQEPGDVPLHDGFDQLPVQRRDVDGEESADDQ